LEVKLFSFWGSALYISIFMGISTDSAGEHKSQTIGPCPTSEDLQNLYLSLPFLWPFSRWTSVSRYQIVSILDFTGAPCDGGGGNNWRYKMCKAPVKMSPPTNQHPVLLTGRMPFP